VQHQASAAGPEAEPPPIRHSQQLLPFAPRSSSSFNLDSAGGASSTVRLGPSRQFSPHNSPPHLNLLRSSQRKAAPRRGGMRPQPCRIRTRNARARAHGVRSDVSYDAGRARPAAPRLRVDALAARTGPAGSFPFGPSPVLPSGRPAGPHFLLCVDCRSSRSCCWGVGGRGTTAASSRCHISNLIDTSPLKLGKTVVDRNTWGGAAIESVSCR